jgi:hypothetical protein
VVSGWCGEIQATPYTKAVAERLLEDRASAPALWDLELTNVLRIACVRQRPGGSRLRWRRRVSHRTKPPNGHRMDGYSRWPCPQSDPRFGVLSHR